MTFLERFLSKLFLHQDITRDGAENEVYLRRWFLYPRQPELKKDVPRIYLHKFFTGDRDPHLHDHPWKFSSLILWGGYWEHRINPAYEKYMALQAAAERDRIRLEELEKKRSRVTLLPFPEWEEMLSIRLRNDLRSFPTPSPTLRRWYGPGSFLKRGARWTHKVELPEGRTAWTLIRTGVKEREWGFHTPEGLCPHQHYRNGSCLF